MEWSRTTDPLSRKHLHPTSPDQDQLTRRMFEQARDGIVNLLTPHSAIQAVGLIRRGYHAEASQNPMVLLVTGKLPMEDWLHVQLQIRTLLARHDPQRAFDLSIELFQAEVKAVATTLHPVPLGAPLSVAHLPWATGSLGGYVRLSVVDDSIVENDHRRGWAGRVYALTCHHVLRPTRPAGIEAPEGGESRPFSAR